MRGPIAMLIVLAAMAIGGCSSTIASRPLTVGLAPALAQAGTIPTIQVDLVGLTERERKEWDARPISAYWLPGSTVRAAAKDRAVSIRFAGENAGPVTIGADHPIRAAWRKAGAQWVYIVANLPGGYDDRPGVDDPRRLAISLNPRAWDEDQEIVIEVRREAVLCRTPPAGKK